MIIRRVLAMARTAVLEARDLFIALVAVSFFAIARLVPERHAVRVGGFLARHVGMWIPRLRRIGLDNLRRAFPDLPEAERVAILRASWDNLGRTAAEYFFMDRIWDFDPANPTAGRIEIDGIERFLALASDDKPAIILSAHLANWELPMLAAERHGLKAAALYTRPKNRWIARMVIDKRETAMGDLVGAGPGALHRLAESLEAGAHVGLLVDQFFGKGVTVDLFGHATKANPTFARLARLYECPVHTVRVIRLAGDRFRIELSEALDLPRDARGRIDPEASTQMVANIIEGWVREYPGQWLWVHRRWR